MILNLHEITYVTPTKGKPKTVTANKKLTPWNLDHEFGYRTANGHWFFKGDFVTAKSMEIT